MLAALFFAAIAMPCVEVSPKLTAKFFGSGTTCLRHHPRVSGRDSVRSSRRFHLDDRFHQIGWRVGSVSGWMLSSQEQVEENAQGINVCCRGYSFASDLLRGGIERSQGSTALERDHRGGGVCVMASNFAIPKSRSFTWPSWLTSTFEGLISRCTTK